MITIGDEDLAFDWNKIGIRVGYEYPEGDENQKFIVLALFLGQEDAKEFAQNRANLDNREILVFFPRSITLTLIVKPEVSKCQS